jgi:hypothetical protein
LREREKERNSKRETASKGERARKNTLPYLHPRIGRGIIHEPQNSAREKKKRERERSREQEKKRETAREKQQVREREQGKTPCPISILASGEE